MMFASPFRVFFLSLALWAVIAVLLWVPQIMGLWQLPLALDPLAWHRHEMLFGFLSPAIAGFLLTAVCVWTDTVRLHGPPLLALWLLWLVGRILMLVGAGMSEVVVIAVNLLFLPLVMLDAGRRIWAARQKRHVIVLVGVGAIWA
ncbi:MAG: NnrS family protein, partial [Chromatocurvus sp.]